ncbi:MAG: SDR family NAD(P)-dependent oxidoreductase [Mycobacteriales bacterium]
MPTALVTGAAGFIGSHLVEHLVGQGWDVRAFVRYSSHDQYGALVHAAPGVLDQVELVPGDLRDADRVRRAVDGVDAVLHLGAVIAIPYSYAAPRDVVETNVLGTLNVLEAARACGTPRVVHTSTSEVYGSAQQLRMDETHPLQGQSPYAASKIGADKVAESYWRSFELPVVTLRPFNTFGPRQSPRAVIPTILGQALAGGPVRLGSLTPTRDFTYVADTVAAFALAATAPDAVGQVVHLGTGVETSIGELVAMAGQVLGRELEVVSEQERVRPPASEVHRLLSDPSHAQDVLGWQPRTALLDGLTRTAEWLERSRDWFRLPGYAV